MYSHEAPVCAFNCSVVCIFVKNESPRVFIHARATLANLLTNKSRSYSTIIILVFYKAPRGHMFGSNLK